MKKVGKILILFLLIFISSFLGCSKEFDDNGYYSEQFTNYTPLSAEEEEAKTVKNVILIIGDGMGENHVTATSMLVNYALDLDKMTYTSMMSTSCLNNEVTDSGASATAMATGYKTNYEVVGKNSEGEDLQTILDAASLEGLKTGIITTKQLYDATPAGFSAHATNRYLRDVVISSQITSGVDILLGGGGSDYAIYYDRITAQGYTLLRPGRGVENMKEALAACDSDKIFGLMSSSTTLSLNSMTPNLADMMKKSIEILSKNEAGFLLIAEEGQIDSYADDNDMVRTAERVVELDKALRVALNFARSNHDTLVIVLADHETGGLEIHEGTPSDDWFTHDYHTAVDVKVYSFGLHAKAFDNKQLDNTDIPKIIANLMGLESFKNKSER